MKERRRRGRENASHPLTLFSLFYLPFCFFSQPSLFSSSFYLLPFPPHICSVFSSPSIPRLSPCITHFISYTISTPSSFSSLSYFLLNIFSYLFALPLLTILYSLLSLLSPVFSSLLLFYYSSHTSPSKCFVLFTILHLPTSPPPPSSLLNFPSSHLYLLPTPLSFTYIHEQKKCCFVVHKLNIYNL